MHRMAYQDSGAPETLATVRVARSPSLAPVGIEPDELVRRRDLPIKVVEGCGVMVWCES